MKTKQPQKRLNHIGGQTNNGQVTPKQVQEDPDVVILLQRTNEIMNALGFTEHGQRHAGLVGHVAEDVLKELNFSPRSCELANIAGLLHDIGNCVHRENHALSGSQMASDILTRMGMPIEERIMVLNAIGNHEEERGLAVTPIAAALIIADKADVHRSRVQNSDMDTFDIHDRVNYATTNSVVRVQESKKIISLELEIDTSFAQVIEYFEIFLSRMTMMRQAVKLLGCEFQLIVNNTRLS